MVLFKNSNEVIELIEKFFDNVDQSLLLFKEGVSNYLYKKADNFNENLISVAKLESNADIIRRDIENKLYTHSLLPQMRGDIMRLLEEFDVVVDLVKKNLYQFEIESPNIPVELNQEFMKLTEISLLAAESVIPAARAYFRTPDTVKDQLHRVYFYEKETDNLAITIKRKVFKEFDNLKLSEKFHLRYFTLHIEDISDTAEKIADILSVMAIKRTI